MKPFGRDPGGATVEIYQITSKNGSSVSITNYGGIVVSLRTADRTGRLADVVLGHDNLDGYLKVHPYFGAIIGRYGNRIGKGQFRLEGKDYKLATNDGANHLHGGIKGFDKAVWKARSSGSNAIELTYLSKDGEEGYPGNLSVKVTYALNDSGELRIDYEASTDRATVINLTNHSYFNLAGQGEGDVLNHRVTLHADRFTPVDSGLIPTGELRPVRGTPFDFTRGAAIGARIRDNDEQLRLGRGYDHNFVLNSSGGQLAKAAEVFEPTTGRVMEVLTTEPGVQFYTGNFLDGTITGKAGKVYGQRSGFCLETQHFPDSPNKPAFPSVVLRPGQQYRSTTIYRFSAR
jgi:aldose 1-epimerase